MSPHIAWRVRARIAAASAACLLVTAAGAQEESPDVERLRVEARAALARGDYQRAHSAWERVVQAAPSDHEALREGGRAAHALGKLQRAESLLGQYLEISSEARDPEAHFLRGEILNALGRTAEANAELDVAREQIGDGPRDRRERLWLARIHALRGEAEAAAALYAKLAEEDPAAPEIPLLWAEGLLLCKREGDAERVLGDLLARDPSNARGRELLAVVFERRREIGKELAVRATLARDVPSAATVRDLGRALERSGDLIAARSAYERARALAPSEDRPGLEDAAERMRLRTAPELEASAAGLSDPSATGGIASAGMAVWLDSRLRIAARGRRLFARTASVDAGATGASLLLVASQPGLEIALSGQLNAAFFGAGRADPPLLGGASAEVRVRAAPWLQLEARGHARLLWDESAATISLGASTTGASATAYALPFGPALVLSVGGMVRALEIPEALASAAPATASQVFGSAGLDWVAWADYAATLRGEALDDALVSAAPFGSALVFSLRQYGARAWQSAAFADWLSLVERASVSELGATVRRTGLEGRAGLELTGGLGYDPLRDALLVRAGAAVVLAPWRSVRLTLRYELGTESQTGLVGRRHMGGLSAHVDL